MITKTPALAALTLALAAALAPAQAAHAATSNALDSLTWTTTLDSGANGSAVLAADHQSLALTSSDYPAFDALRSTELTFGTVLTQDTTLSFSWSFNSNDENGPAYDPFGLVIAGQHVQLSQNDGDWAQAGTYTWAGKKGQSFAFYAASTDSIFGAATTTISSFTSTPAVPEPASMALMMAGLGLLGARMRRQSRG